jgi:CO/xanthine dehydrogenase FAD-binding subunit
VSLVIADSLDQALAAVASGARPIAGGTDLVVGARQGTAPLPDSLVAIDRLSQLKGVRPGGDDVRIGAAVTHAELMTDTTVVGSYTALADAAALVGSPSTRNVGTLGGNVMNASPAMDTGAPLLVLDATVELMTSSGRREIPLSELWVAPGVTSAAPYELCVALRLPRPAERHGSAYVRLEYRRAMEIAVVGAAASVSLDDDGSVVTCRLALTAVAPTIVEVNGLAVEGSTATDAGIAAAAAARATARPISDLRASNTYRSHMVGVMARRAVGAAAGRAAGETISVPVNRSIGIGAS